MILIDAANWIQAAGTLVGVILALVTLLVLLRYADDTATIAKVSASQVEHSQMPCLVVVMTVDNANAARGWAIENVGAGPALNIHFTGFSGGNNPERKQTPPLGSQKQRYLHHDISEVFTRWPRDFRMEYESLSGTEYSTTVDMTGEMKTQFHRPPEKLAANTIRDVLKRFWRSF